MEIEFTISKPGHIVYEYLSDMQKFVSVHPIIFRIDPLGDNRYLVFERLKVLFVPYTFNYIVTVDGNKHENKITISTTVKKMVHIKMEFHIQESEGVSKVKEKVEFRSFLPVKPIMRKIFREQHGLLFSNIGKL
ncbi:MAG: hypothetical protein K0S32_656 [Bacteroidetes bacterium]|jgi:carbon monoxide dehydrogenase subunit G|nr:hypothetical protein [Bacteroidota bacterium]